jgi:hypothetical protein
MMKTVAGNVKFPATGRHGVGVDLGSAFGGGFVSFRPRKEYERNCRGITFYGSNDESGKVMRSRAAHMPSVMGRTS